ncbi:hypothetical protein J7W19_13510 [Streptomyces mobaraensis NBRC 13819 = DSM 40847]|uniref:Uncharacterized protein n=2 Tax=Streptomyces mobaraensis TaxID=35621 RepID=A0A5N5W3L0_STRMB|nr:hypothetical protein [Streptomyces mobaraensis]EME96735.1 hypothetical protein H340_30041 [Streptomyces mobaraensis NBRC 13819 = DSM 40847]KAB7838004.1 hypothetical protein FRZ00_22570 [Streptomyces mobaraensis]QTT74285.1 hypothetical protein J7W19_13510 [Streptomyces mobaraensis NBRC 13819 = DSM 40847]
MTQQAEPGAIPDEAPATAPDDSADADDAGGSERFGGPEREERKEPSGRSRAPRHQDGFGAAFCASMAALCAEVVVAASVGVLVLLSREHQGLPTAPALAVGVALGALLLVVLLSGFVTAAAVMPALELSRRAAARAGRPEGRWWTVGAVPAVAAALVIVFGAVAALGALAPAHPLKYLIWWGALTVGLLPPALAARRAARRVREDRPGSVARRVARDGVLAWLLVGAIGATAYGTGLATVYQPPKLHRSDIAGVWNDGRGGTVRLMEDGSAVADGLDTFDWDGMGHDRIQDCNGSGSWTPVKESGAVVGVGLRIDACGRYEKNWSVGGTAKEPRIFHEIGKQGSGKRYMLKKMHGSKG